MEGVRFARADGDVVRMRECRAHFGAVGAVHRASANVGGSVATGAVDADIARRSAPTAAVDSLVRKWLDSHATPVDLFFDGGLGIRDCLRRSVGNVLQL